MANLSASLARRAAAVGKRLSGWREVTAAIGRLILVSVQARRSSPVFIVGEARSGSSLLYRILLGHSSFRTARPELSETHLLQYLDRIERFAPRQPRRLWHYMLKDDAAFGAFLTTLRTMAHLPAAYRERTVLRSYFHHARLARGCRRLVEKSPPHVEHIPQILDAFPRAKLLYIHRHPVDVFSSYRRRLEVDPESKSWADLSPERFCDLWSEHLRLAGAAVAEMPDSVCLVRYDTLIKEPEAELRRICTFLAEPFESQALAEPTHAAWEQDPHLFGAITSHTKNWRDHMTSEEADHIQDRLGSLTDRLGYQRYT